MFKYKQQEMNNEQTIKLRPPIEGTISRMQPLKPLMFEDELEDFEYYESFDIFDYTEKNMLINIREINDNRNKSSQKE